MVGAMRKRIAINDEQWSIRTIGYSFDRQDGLVAQLWPTRGLRHSFVSEDVVPTKRTTH